MRKFRFLLATLLLVAIPLGVNAQEKLIKTDSPEGANYMTDNIIGLSVDALRTKLIKDKEPGRLSGGRRKGEYMVYDLLSIGTRKRYKSNGDYYYEANVDTPYIRYYFKNGKLEKWVCLD